MRTHIQAYHQLQGGENSLQYRGFSFASITGQIITRKWASLIVFIILHLNVNTLRPRQNGRHFADDIFNCIFLNENVWIPIKISLKFLPKDPINNIPALVQIMAWRHPGDKPSFEPTMVNLLTHRCVNRLQWVNWEKYNVFNISLFRLVFGKMYIMLLIDWYRIIRSWIYYIWKQHQSKWKKHKLFQPLK